MSTLTKILFSSFFVIAFLSCREMSDLGEQFYYMSEEEAIDVGSRYGAIIYKSRNKSYYDSIYIENKVIDVDYDENHIIAVRKKCLNEYDSGGQLIKRNYWCEDTLQYFIIDKERALLYGPFNFLKFDEYRKKLNIMVRI